MAPPAYVTHRTPSRLRIRVPSRKGDVAYFARVQSYLVQQKSLKRVEANPLTAGLLLEAREDAQNPFAQIEPNEWFEIQTHPPGPKLVAHRMVEQFRILNTQVEQFTNGELDIAGIALIGLVVAGIYQVSMGNFTAPAWYTAFWYATSIAVKSDKSPKPNGLM